MSKVAVVTGASQGLGAAIAFYLASCGYSVVVHYHKSTHHAQKTLAKLKKISPDSVIISADLTNEEQVFGMFNKILQKHKRIDLLVNNVGDFIYKPFAKTTNKEFRNMMDTNIFATLFCSRQALHFMRKKKSGQIVNIGVEGSGRVLLREKSTAYFMAKNGVYALTKAMAWEEARNGIRVNMISPSSLKADIFSRKDFPTGRPARFEDVINTLEFLLSDKAYYINGANIEVSGGFVSGMK